jgi:pyranose oxidase
MGSYWSCATPEQHPIIERSELFSDEEWSSLYGQARALFHTTDRDFDHSLRHQLVKDTLIRAHKGREVANLPLACQRSTSNPEYVRWTGPATILGELANPTYNGGNFKLKAQHQCTRLLLDAASKRILGAELTDMLTNEVLLARAKRYIICAGAILTAGILFNSHIRSETGYPALVLPH